MNFNKIEIDTWHRKDAYEQFTEKLKCVITLTSQLDVLTWYMPVKKAATVSIPFISIWLPRC